MIYFLIFSLLFSPFGSYAQTDGYNIQSLNDESVGFVSSLLTRLKELKIDVRVPFIEKAYNEARSITSSPENIVPRIKEYWDRSNSWLDEKIGLNFKEIYKIIGNVSIWIFEFLIKLIRSGLSYL